MKYGLEQAQQHATLAMLCGLLLGCYATTHRGPQTLAPGKISVSGGYAKFFDEDISDGLDMLQVDARVGVMQGLDVGYMRTFDITKDLEDDEGYDTHWFDAKLQLSNRSNVPNKLAVSLGYGFGNPINIDDLYVKTLYVTAGSEQQLVSPYYSFRYEVFSEEFGLMPNWVWESEWEEVRKGHIVGAEFTANPNFRPVVEFGRFYDEDIADGFNVFTVGINYYR